MNKFITLVAAASAVALAAPAHAVTIDFETDDLGNATNINNAIGATDYDAFGATFTGAVFRQCGGGCPTPAGGTFISGTTFQDAITVTFSSAINFFSFENVSNSSGTASAFDAGNNLLGSVNFADFPGLFSFNQAGIKAITFSTTSQYGVDNFTFDVKAAVPEPATWLMMLMGFGFVGGAMRYRQRSTKVAFAA